MDYSVHFPPPISFSRPPDAAKPVNVTCCMWALLAFLLGVIVGVTLPYILDKDTVKSVFANQFYKDESRWNSTVLQFLSRPSKDHVAFVDPSAKFFMFEKSVNSRYSEPLNTSLIEEILDGNVFFGVQVEEALPNGFSDQDVDDWRDFVKHQTVVHMHEGCGRMQNRLLTFANGTQSCCRYRQNLDQIQGEIFSFYLSRILGIHNVPPSALAVVKAGSRQWKRVSKQMALAYWAEEHPVVMTKFVDDLGSAAIPVHFRTFPRRLHPIDLEDYNITDSLADLVRLSQWSDLLIFDYLTGNLDRIVNNLFNLQWNPSMMDAPAHNLAIERNSNLLVFLDNESGLLHGYRLLDKYEPFHESLLQSLCLFRKSTADNIKQLLSRGDAGEKLIKMFMTYEPEIQHYLPAIPDKTIQILNERLKRVYKQIQKCRNLYINS